MQISKNRIARSIVLRLAPCALAAALLAPARPAAADPGGTAVGNIEANAGINLYLGFQATGSPTSASGVVTYANASGLFFSGDVSCYFQSGREAGIAGPITITNMAAGRSYFFIRVTDSPAGRGVRVNDPAPSMPDCTSLDHVYPGRVIEGTLHVGAGNQQSIVSASSGMCLDDPAGSATPGTLMQQWSCDGGANQQWQAIANSDGVSFSLVSVTSGLCLDVPGGSTAAGTQIQEWPCTGGANQRWTAHPAGASGQYNVVSVNSGLCLDVPGASTTAGTRIQQWPCNGGANQQWSL